MRTCVHSGPATKVVRPHVAALPRFRPFRYVDTTGLALINRPTAPRGHRRRRRRRTLAATLIRSRVYTGTKGQIAARFAREERC